MKWFALKFEHEEGYRLFYGSSEELWKIAMQMAEQVKTVLAEQGSSGCSFTANTLENGKIERHDPLTEMVTKGIR